jgi:hypothetical protein
MMAIAVRLFFDDALHVSRRAHRTTRAIEATVRLGDTQACDAFIHNLSVSGCLVETPIELDDGETVSIGIAGLGMISACVTRRDDVGYGLSFDTLLSEAALAEAGRYETVVTLPFVVKAQPESSMPSPDRWSRRTRLLVILGIASSCWAIVSLALHHLLA